MPVAAAVPVIVATITAPAHTATAPGTAAAIIAGCLCLRRLAELLHLGLGIVAEALAIEVAAIKIAALEIPISEILISEVLASEILASEILTPEILAIIIRPAEIPLLEIPAIGVKVPIAEIAVAEIPVLETAVEIPVIEVAVFETPIAETAVVEAAIIIPAAAEAMAAIEVQSQRGTITAFMPPVRTGTAPFVITPAAANPILTPAIPVAIIDRTVIPTVAIVDGTIIDRQIPIIVRATIGIAIAAGVIGKIDAAIGLITIPIVIAIVGITGIRCISVGIGIGIHVRIIIAGIAIVIAVRAIVVRAAISLRVGAGR